MSDMVIASATLAIVITFGVAILAAAVGLAAIYATLGSEDRGQLVQLARHPLKTVFSERVDDPDPEDQL